MGPGEYSLIKLEDNNYPINSQIAKIIDILKTKKEERNYVIPEILQVFFNDIDKIKITKEEFVELLLSQGILDALSDIMLKEKVEDNQLKLLINELMSILTSNCKNNKKDAASEEFITSLLKLIIEGSTEAQYRALNTLEIILSSEESERIGELIKKSNLFNSLPFLLKGNGVSEERKKGIMKIFIEILKRKIIVKGGNGEDVVRDILIIAKDIENECKEKEEEEEMEELEDCAHDLIRMGKRRGWDVEKEKKKEEYEMELEKKSKIIEETKRMNERINKEKEEKNKEIEKIKKENEKIQREKEQLRNELEELKRVPPPITSLSSLSLSFSSSSYLKKEGDYIVHHGTTFDQRYPSNKVYPTGKKYSYGVVDADKGSPANDSLYGSGRVYGSNGSELGSADVPLNGDEVALEVDLRSSEKSKRTLHFFVKGKQQNIYFTGLPVRIKFALNLCYQDTKILFKSLEELKEPSANRNEGNEKKWSQ